MKLYHGSKFNTDKLINKQASKPEDLTGIPEAELQNGIYMSPSYEFALAMGTRPHRLTNVESNDKTVMFEDPELFNPDEEVFMYTFDSDKIPTEKLEHIDDLHYIVKGMDELVPIEKESLKAGELFKYYKLTEWKETKEIIPEQKFKMM